MNLELERQYVALQKYAVAVSNVVYDALKQNEEFVVDFIAQDQLYEKGIDSKGRNLDQLKPYTPLTIEIKKIKGQPYGRVTLRDEGDFQRSFYIQYNQFDFVFMASDPKTPKLLKKYGEDILSLTPENIERLRNDYVLPLLAKINEDFKQGRELVQKYSQW